MLDALLLDVGFLDLVWEPCWSVFWLVNHRDAAREHVDTLGAALTKADGLVSAGCCLQGCTTGLLARKNLARIFSVLHENEVFLIRIVRLRGVQKMVPYMHQRVV